MPTKLDVVFLVLDTQRADRLSCYGYTQPTSPHLDALAADATLFRRAYSPAQWTVPSHSSLFTGLYPSAHATQQSSSILPSALTPLAQRMWDGGYFTAAFCNNPLVGVVDNGLRRGFYSFLNYSGWLTSRPNQAGQPVTVVGRYRQFFKRVLTRIMHHAQDSFARSDALLEFAMTPLMVPFWQTALSFKGNTGRSLNDAADLLINRRGLQPDQPIFSFINLMGTHMPFHPDRKQVERFAPTLLRNRNARRFLRQFNSDVFGWFAPLAKAMDAEQKQILDGMYDAEVATQDQQVGHFFERLRTSGALDRTLVVICADHGDHLGEHGFIGHSISLYNVLTHVPLIVRDPAGNLARGSVRDDVVSTRRLFHTVLNATGLAENDEERYTLAQSPSSDPDQGVVFAEGIAPQNVLSLMQKHRPDLVRKYHCDQPRRAVWAGQHKLILTGSDHLELFDLAADPGENKNLVATLPAVTELMRGHLTRFAHQMEAAALPAERITDQNDPLLRQRLRALGYME